MKGSLQDQIIPGGARVFSKTAMPKKPIYGGTRPLTKNADLANLQQVTRAQDAKIVELTTLVESLTAAVNNMATALAANGVKPPEAAPDAKPEGKKK